LITNEEGIFVWEKKRGKASEGGGKSESAIMF
jgi:hypothetical protein